jgi:hypothetical protein
MLKTGMEVGKTNHPNGLSFYMLIKLYRCFDPPLSFILILVKDSF